MPRRLGRSGERRFATLVADFGGGASCNDSHEDDHGWDHIVEFDQPRAAPGAPADMVGALPPCFVQTKTTASRTSMRASMKLSNALALTRSDNPCFVVLVSSPADGPVRFHAVHWWRDEMERALRRARELHRDGVGPDDLHRHTLRITLRPSDLRNERGLVGWMRSAVVSAGSDYGRAKGELRSSLGFGEARFVGSVQVGPLGSLEELVAHQLGLTPGIPVAEFELRHRRFGVDVAVPVPEGPYADARMQANPAAACEVRLRGPDGDGFTVPGQLYVPSLGGIPEELLKYRIKTAMFDLVWRPGGPSRLTSTFSTAHRMRPDMLANRALFHGWGGAGDIDVLAKVDEDRLLGATATLDPPPDVDGWRRIAPPLRTLALLAADHATQPSISIEDAMDATNLQMLHDALAATETTLDAMLTPDADPGGFDHAIAFAAIHVGEWNFAALLNLPLASRTLEGRRLRVSFGRARIVETYVGHVGNERPISHLTADYRRHAARSGALELDNLLLHLAGQYFADANGG